MEVLSVCPPEVLSPTVGATGLACCGQCWLHKTCKRRVPCYGCLILPPLSITEALPRTSGGTVGLRAILSGWRLTSIPPDGLDPRLRSPPLYFTCSETVSQWTRPFITIIALVSASQRSCQPYVTCFDMTTPVWVSHPERSKRKIWSPCARKPCQKGPPRTLTLVPVSAETLLRFNWELPIEQHPRWLLWF